MSHKFDWSISQLNPDNGAHIEQSIALITQSFANNDFYQVERIRHEIATCNPFYQRVFFIATHNEQVIGIGGIRSAEWASKTHILYLSAVHESARQQGIGRALIQERIKWIKSNNDSGRIIVSTAKIKRFKDFGFCVAHKSKLNNKNILIYTFNKK